MAQSESVVIVVTPTVCSGGSFQIKNIYDSPSSTFTNNPYQESEARRQFKLPEFILPDSGNVTAILGSPASLTCRVRNVANRTVSSNILLNYNVGRNKFL